jgi:aminopeptidase N
MFRPFVLAALLLAGLTAPSAAQQSERHWIEGGATPLRYEIALTPNVEAGTFTGQATIRVRADEPVSSITMNALDLEIQRATIDNRQAAVALNAEAQTLTLTPRSALRAGEHTIRINYTGRVLDDAYGLFRVSYTDDAGQTRKMMATQFEPADARRLAPMWDQPNRRAIFSMTVTAPTDQMVVGNMPIARQQRVSGGLTRTTFQDTPSMSSYLLFLAVGDFERITTTVDGIEVGVVVRRGQTERGRYALRAAEEVINYYHEYFGIEYPLPKLDMIGVPGAGGFGAMENWGAILYFDQYLLLDEDRSNEGDRQFVFTVVAHEIAHQWFGNLVTMVWWDDLWLNEGFASWMAAKAVEERHPDWQPWMLQLTDGTESAMGLDARVGTHPIVQTVNTIDEANLAFDDITYDKGLAVIRMLEGYVGEDAFRNGVRSYLNAHLYGNAQTEDLWRAVQEASGQPVLEIARGFTRQPGYPVLAAAGADCRREANNGVINITQRRFALDEVSRTAELWPVPLVAQRVGAEPVRSVLPASASSTVDLGSCGAYVLNAGQSGFFRVNYDRANLERLTSGYAQLDSNDQLGLLLDYWAFGRSGDAQFTDYLDMAAQIPADADPVIVSHLTESVASLAGYSLGRPSQTQVIAWGRATLRPYLDRVGWDGNAQETSNVIKMRADLINVLGGLGDEQVIAEVRRRVEGATANPALLPAGIRDAAYDVYAKNATTQQYDALLARARAATDFVEQRRAWNQLGNVRDEALARRTLEITLTEEVPRQLRTQVLERVARVHPRMAWDFLVAHRSQYEALLDPLSRLEYPPGIADHSDDPAVATSLEQYAANFPAGAQPTVRSAAANIRLRANMIQTQMPAVEQWIARHRTAAPRGR